MYARPDAVSPSSRVEPDRARVRGFTHAPAPEHAIAPRAPAHHHPALPRALGSAGPRRAHPARPSPAPRARSRRSCAFSSIRSRFVDFGSTTRRAAAPSAGGFARACVRGARRSANGPVAEVAACPERAVGLERDAALLAGLEQPGRYSNGLNCTWYDRRVVAPPRAPRRARRVEVRDPDRAGVPALVRLLHAVPRPGRTALRPVDDVQVDLVDPEPVQAARASAGSCEAGELRRDEDVLAGHAALAQRPSDARLVAVRLRGVDVAVPELERPAHGLIALGPSGTCHTPRPRSGIRGRREDTRAPIRRLRARCHSGLLGVGSRRDRNVHGTTGRSGSSARPMRSGHGRSAPSSRCCRHGTRWRSASTPSSSMRAAATTWAGIGPASSRFALWTTSYESRRRARRTWRTVRRGRRAARHGPGLARLHPALQGLSPYARYGPPHAAQALTASVNFAPALNRGALDAAIAIGSPVAGLTP